MKGLGYFEKLSLAARWLLPREEAEGMMDDYRDILLELEGPQEALERFGPPGRLVRGLAEEKKVRRWYFWFAVTVFLVIGPCAVYFSTYRQGNISYGMSDMFLCCIVFFAGFWVILAGSYHKAMTAALTVLLAGVVGFLYYLGPSRALTDLYNRLTGWHHIIRIGLPWRHEAASCFFVAALITLVLFGFRGRLKKKMSKFLIVSLCLAALGVAGIFVFCWYSFYVDAGLILHLGWVKGGCFFAGGLCLAGALFSIVMARMYDRRWRAVWILCLTGLALCLDLHYLTWNWSACLWQLVRDYEAGNTAWTATYIAVEPLASELPIYFESSMVLAALGLI